MKKIYLIGAAATLMTLAACSDDAINTSIDEYVAQKQVPVTFGTYLGQKASTRAGNTDPMTTAKMQETGFGVFAYNTGANDYIVGGATGQTPNFMYNQKVSGSSWTYSPVKYWPNLSGTADNQTAPAMGDAANEAKLSFFAYAPYVDLTETGADLNNNIVKMTANDAATEDPTITYMFPTTGKSVDLLWGIADNTDENVLGTSQPTTGEVVNVNLTKQKTDGKIKFLFKHALSNVGGSATVPTKTVSPDPRNDDETGSINIKTGGFQAVLDIDNTSSDPQKKENKTVVTIKNIKIKGENKLATAVTDAVDQDGNPYAGNAGDVILGGQLNLATGNWKYVLKNAAGTAVSNDGSFNHNVTSDASSDAEKTAKNATLNKDIAEPASITASTQWSSLPWGVLPAETQNIYEDETNPLVFMPGTKPHLTVTVEYIVRTLDDKLDAGWTEVAQTITKTIDFENAIEKNKKYNLIMHLGLTSVKFDATVEDWSAYNPDSSIDPTDPSYTPDPSNPSDPANTVDVPVYVPLNVN